MIVNLVSTLECFLPLQVDMVDETICCSCCLLADMSAPSPETVDSGSMSSASVISLTEVLNHPKVTKAVRNQWLRALNNAAKPTAGMVSITICHLNLPERADMGCERGLGPPPIFRTTKTSAF